MDWRQPSEEIGSRLAVARDTVLVNTTDPWRAVGPFEPILEELRYVPTDREVKLTRLRSLGRQLFAEIGSGCGPVAMEIRHYCWHLQHVGDPAGSPASSVADMLMVTLTRFAHYEGHEVARCPICAEFRGDLPFQGSPEGRAHYREWLSRRSADAAE